MTVHRTTNLNHLNVSVHVQCKCIVQRNVCMFTCVHMLCIFCMFMCKLFPEMATHLGIERITACVYLFLRGVSCPCLVLIFRTRGVHNRSLAASVAAVHLPEAERVCTLPRCLPAPAALPVMSSEYATVKRHSQLLRSTPCLFHTHTH